MSEEDEVELPESKASEVPAWIQQQNEKQRGLGFNPTNARKLAAGGARGEEAPEEYNPTQEDMDGAKKFFSHMWDVYMDWRKNRPAMKKKEQTIAGWHEQQSKNKTMYEQLRRQRAADRQVHLGDETAGFEGRDMGVE